VMSIIFSPQHTRLVLRAIGTVVYAREYHLVISFLHDMTHVGENRKKSPAHPVALVAEVSTLRRHMQSQHKV